MATRQVGRRAALACQMDTGIVIHLLQRVRHRSRDLHEAGCHRML